MDANKFFKKHGLAEVKILLTSPSHGFFFKEDFYKHYGFDIYEDLKRLLESHELVGSYKGLHCTKNTLGLLQSSMKIGLYHGIDGVDAATEIPRLEQAIADVESCQ